MTMPPVFDPDLQYPLYDALLCRAALQKALDVNFRNAAQSVLNISGGGELLAFAYLPDSWPPSYLVAKQERSYEIVLSGTQQAGEILVHLAGVVAPHRTPSGWIINGGWADVWGILWDTIEPLIGPDCQRLTISGHSYGGGVVTCAMVMSQDEIPLDFPSVQAVTFGAPRSVLGGEQPNTTRAIVRCASLDDPVPTLPPSSAGLGASFALQAGAGLAGVALSWLHCGWTVHVDGDAAVSSLGYVDDAPPASEVSFLPSGFRPHTSSVYLSRLSRLMRSFYGRG